MLNSYHRRAFIALAVLAPTTASANTAPAGSPLSAAPANVTPTGTPASVASTPHVEEAITLWEALSHVERKPKSTNSDPDEPVRVPLGAVPGFTLPALDRIGDPGTPAAGGKKVYRGPLGSVNRVWDAILKATGSSFEPKGSASLQIRKDSFKGGSQASQAYKDQYYLGQGSNGIYSNAEMHVDATLFKSFHYSSTISTNPYTTPGQNRFKIDYSTSKARMQIGDINAGFQGNSLIDFNRYLSGVQVENKWSRQLKTTTLFSKIKAETKTLSVAGLNSAGPYYMFSGQIVDGSAHVRVDNRDMQAGKDYTLDPTTGELRFLNGNVILQSQTIAITYETLGYGQQQGSIYGFRSAFTPGGTNNFGMTVVTQQTPRGTRLQQIARKFEGQPSALAPYTVDAPIDTTKPYSVYVDGSLQVPRVDYTIDATFGNIVRLKAPLLPSQSVNITYVPLDTTQNPGNRSVIGLDGHMGLGKWGGVTLETAMSGLTLGSTNYPGKAAQIRLDLNPIKNLATHFTVRDVGATYSSVQSPGFNRNEKSVEMSGEYTPFSKLHLSFEMLKAKRPSYSISSGTTSTGAYSLTSAGSDSYNQYTLGASYDLARNLKVNLSRNNLGTQYLVGGQSTSTSDNLSLTWGLRAFSIDVGLIRSLNDTNTLASLYGLTPTPGTTGANTLIDIRTSTLTRRLGANWQPLKWLHLDGSFSENAITNTGNIGTTALTSTNATDRQITARFQPPIKGLTFSYSYDLSDTGSAQTIGGTSATGTTGSTVSAVGATASGAASTSTTTGTITTTGTGTGGALGVASTRSFFTPWVTRDSATGVTTTTATTGFGTSLGSVGGGINSTLGAAGNYSGFLGNSYSNVGLTGIGGRTSSNRLGMNYAISRGLTLQTNYDVASSVGDYQYNSNRKNALASLVWNPSERWAFNGSFNVSHVNYTGSLGATRSSQMQFGFSGRPFGNRITTTLSYQSVKTNSALNTAAAAIPLTGVSTGTTTAGSLLTGISGVSNLSSLAARVDYPLSVRHALFIDWLNSSSTGSLGDIETDLRFGMDFYLNQFLKFSLGWQTTDRANKDSTLTNLNYHNSSLLAEFGLHF